MEHLTCPMPNCGAPLDLFEGVVGRQRTYPVVDRGELLRGFPLLTGEVTRTEQVVTCSRCEFAETTKRLLAGEVGL